MKLRIFALLSIAIFTISCSQKQAARKPVSHSSGTFMKESIERNKKLFADEEAVIEDLIKKDTANEYIASTKGYWYTYNTKVEDKNPYPKKGDIVYFTYDVKNLQKATIYTSEELKPQRYYVDKENIMTGLRNGIKHMKKGESITFYFPSHMGYGYLGDKNKIEKNEPLICTVTVNDIEFASN